MIRVLALITMIHLFTNGSMSQVPATVSLRCPACRQAGTFSSTTQADLRALVENRFLHFGQRICPNPACNAHLFVVYDDDRSVVEAFPPETIDFDSTALPKNVLDAFEEAIKCHAAQCETAAAMMVRKTLEEVCLDRDAMGDTLYDRIESLGQSVVLPVAMTKALHNLRLLGNDAAHVESKGFSEVGAAEVLVAIDVVKEILKSTYQYESIMGRLEALKSDSGA